MNKQQWINMYNVFEKLHYTFLKAYPKYKKGKNKRVMKEAEQQVDNTISSFKILMRQNEEACELFFETEGFSDFDYEELFCPCYFDSSMKTLLAKIEIKIEEAND